MAEPTRPTFGRIPGFPGDGYVIETGAAAGMKSMLKPEHLFGIRCEVCGGAAGMGTDGRLYFDHIPSKHFLPSAPPASAGDALSKPLRREEAGGGDWWNA
jgi:hypothetical protein